MIIKWISNVLIGVDQLANAIAFGDPDESVSSRIGKLKLKYSGCIPWRRPFAKILDWALERIDPGHSIDAIEPDEGSDAVLRDERRKF